MNGIRKALSQSINIGKSAFIWNALSSLLLASQSVLVLMILTRVIGIEEAGVFSFAHSNANLMFFIGEFGVRRYQASDVNEKYKSSEYYGFRTLSCVTMILIIIAFCGYSFMRNGYTFEKVLIVFFVGMCLVVQAASDVYEANMQQKGRLDIAAKSAFLRTLSLIFAYAIGIFLTKSLLISSIMAFGFALVVFLLTSWNMAIEYGGRYPTFRFNKFKGIFLAVFPIFITLFLNNYIANAPKYAIDACLGDELQAIYGFLFMPTYAIGVICNFIFNPIIVKYAKLWTEKRIEQFRKLVLRQMGIIGGMTVLAIGAAYVLGIPVLSLIFGTDLSGYRVPLCIMIVGGGMWAYCTFFTTVITIMRKQNSLLIGYTIAAVATLILAKRIIIQFGILGAAWMYTAIMSGLAFILMLFLFRGIKMEAVA